MSGRYATDTNVSSERSRAEIERILARWQAKSFVLSPEQAAAVRASLEASGARMRAAAQAFAEAIKPGLAEFEQRMQELIAAVRR